MKIFRSEQIRQIDDFTIRNEPVASVDLMERAASRLFEWYVERFPRSRRILIFTGPGNNGGDGLALARMLAKNRYKPEVFHLHFTESVSADWKTNRERLKKETSVPFNVNESGKQFPRTGSDDIIIDAVFGTGLTRPVNGIPAEIIHQINGSGCSIIAIDIPSGLYGEDNNANNPENIIRADFTLSFQFPRLAFMFRENEIYTGSWEVLPIGLDQRAIFNTKTPFEFLEKTKIASLLKNRKKFDHKGDYGHGLLIGGSYGKMGAIVLGARAALRTGAGLLSCHVPSCGNLVLQIALPEAMVNHDSSERFIKDNILTEKFDAIAIGPGLGTLPESHNSVQNLFRNCKKPLVMDADALNILSVNRDWLSILPENSILTPHPGEFERLAGKSVSGMARLEKQIKFSQKHNCIVVLKGAHTSVTTPSGEVCFNSTGNPGMATAGSGDVLTGMILSLLAQQYDPVAAAVTGVYLHGLAGDIAAERSCYESVIASDIIDGIPDAFRRIREQN
jgi:hydroxyethylthiazole kinase-like uncharacterized protein yjeF